MTKCDVATGLRAAVLRPCTEYWRAALRQRRSIMRPLILSLLLAASAAMSVSAAAARQSITLRSDWQFQTNGATAAWKNVTLPANWETHEGTAFNGVGWYRRGVPRIKVPNGSRVLLRFDAAATFAEVFWNGQHLGTHLGGWTPFRFDVTELAQRGGVTNEIRVRLDERVGHNTQGFLPIIAPHFGGIWKDVSLEIVPQAYVDELSMLAVGNPDTQQIELELPVSGATANVVEAVDVKWRLVGKRSWNRATFQRSRHAKSEHSLAQSDNTLLLKVPVGQAQLWSPHSPNLYDLEIRLATAGNQGADVVRTRAGFRKLTADGTRLLLNGQPLNVRGVLNWGYYPPSLAPSPSEKQMKEDLEFVRDNGFNLLKFCLWMPPKRFLELADEMGILTWVEYPTWHPQLTPKHLDDLRNEFREFFHYDRNHPSAILRSLTCETGPSADIKVIQALYDEAKRMIPGVLVEDDSSWISWNRVSDFYDDHPYGNNHTWVSTLAGLNDYVAKHTPKPLLLGEAIAADTWPDWNRISRRRSSTPDWALPGPLIDQQRWIDRMKPVVGQDAFEPLRADSLRYGMLMRKYQAETFRREVPGGGYIVSVIRDFRGASMGMIDYLGEPKWKRSDWAWQGDTALILRTSNDRRSIGSSESFECGIVFAHAGSENLTAGKLNLALRGRESKRAMATVSADTPRITPGQTIVLSNLVITAPQVAEATPATLEAAWSVNGKRIKNEWPVWIVPMPAPTRVAVWSHPTAPAVFPGARPLAPDARDGILVASIFDESVTAWLDAGRNVLLFPDGKRNSLPMRSHWFLRGAPVIANRYLPAAVPRDLLVELQHFDLAGPVIPQPPYLLETDPWLSLWDTHDRTNVLTHGLVFETRAGQGRLLVSALAHTNSPAGAWLASVLVNHLARDHRPAHALSPATWNRLKQQINAEEMRLTDRDWEFRPDKNAVGAAEGWATQPGDNAWTKIRIGRSWESQGHPGLDGWAWYRLRIKVPDAWRQRSLFLTFTGVDDMYELYVNGAFVARRGDIATKKDTFSETYSHDITAHARADDLLIAVRVYDWYGAGGIFQPAYLGTVPHGSDGDILSRGR